MTNFTTLNTTQSNNSYIQLSALLITTSAAGHAHPQAPKSLGSLPTAEQYTTCGALCTQQVQHQRTNGFDPLDQA
jgi:hypothetical protein